MASFKHGVLEYLTDAQVGDQQARLHLLRLGLSSKQDSVPEIFAEAAAYRLRGWSVVPQLPCEKKPCVRWKPYQTRLPTVDDVETWWRRWPDAGIAVVLGPVSDLFAVDVDGEDAHRALIGHLGRVPKTVRSISGSNKPHRYHLFFSHPRTDTNAKYCPWHPQLEFRGQGGIVVLPPSKHKSGGHYRWANGASVFEIAPAQVPISIVRELQKRVQGKSRHAAPIAVKRPKTLTVADRHFSAPLRRRLTRETKRFLAGKYANRPNWNCRLFKAACDLAGNSVPLETATRLLLAGAKPWNNHEVENALRTIGSAYSQERSPAKRVNRSVHKRRNAKGRRR